jgi:phage terminase Nu1 subunit (DNA packaging protein)
MALINQAKFAEMHGVSRKTVTGWKTRGWLVLEGGQVDVDASNALLIKHRPGGVQVVTQPAPGNKSGNTGNRPARVTVEDDESLEEAALRVAETSGEVKTLDEARLMKEKYLAYLNRLQYDKESGLVVEAAQVAAAVGAEYAKVRTRLLSIPAEQAPYLHRLKTVTEVQDALQQMITDALEELTIDGDG